MALDSLLNTDFFTFYREYQRPAQCYSCSCMEYTFLNFDFWSSVPDSDFCLKCKLYSFKLFYWLLCFLVMWSLIYSFLNLFWRSKICQSGLAKWYLKNIKYINNMWYISKHHDIWKISWYFRFFDILKNIMIFSHPDLDMVHKSTGSHHLFLSDSVMPAVLKIETPTSFHCGDFVAYMIYYQVVPV